MGSQAIQGRLWGQRPSDWATIQEFTGKPGYDYALEFLQITPTDNLLDVGCGSGIFCSLAKEKGIAVTGIDASAELIEEAKKRVPGAPFSVGEMEELPFDDASFSIVTGFNSFQYATSTKNALAEAKRVLQKNGKLVVMIWGNKDDCEAVSYIKALGSLMPPPPPGAPGPFALSENQMLENILEEIGFDIVEKKDVTSIWDYPDTETALKGLISAGPVARVIDNSGFKKVYETLAEAIKPFTQANGHVVYHNKFRVVIAQA